MTILIAPEKGAASPGANLLSDIALPALVIHQDALDHNIGWMQASPATAAPNSRPMARPAWRRRCSSGSWPRVPGA